MKKLIVLLLAACIVIPSAMAEKEKKNKQLEKLYKKELNTKMKQYKKEKWTLFGSARSFEVALAEHYDKLNKLGENGREISGTSTRCKSKNVGHQQAAQNACISYARECGSQLQGRVVTDMSADATTTDGEFDRFYGAYEASIEKEIRGELQESFSVIRTNADGTFEIESYFIVNEDAASRARMRALENAMKESDMARNNAEKISSFVRERVQ